VTGVTDFLERAIMHDYIRDWMDAARFIVHLIDDFPDDWKSIKVKLPGGSYFYMPACRPERKEKHAWL